MNRREKLILGALNNVEDPQEARNLDTTLRLVLADMGEQHCEFWKRKGPGVLFFSPTEKRPLFYKTLKDLHRAMEMCEQDNDGDLAESFRRILKRAEKIAPLEKAGYVILDDEGMRYIEIDYNKTADAKPKGWSA